MHHRNPARRSPRRALGTTLLLLLSLILPAASAAAARPFVLVITKEDLKDAATAASDGGDPPDDSPEWDQFGDPDSKSEDDLDPGSWRPIFEPSHSESALNSSSADDEQGSLYLSGVRAMVSAVTSGDPAAMEEAASDIEAAAALGSSHAQSALGFLYGAGITRPQSRPKSFLYHQFAAEGGNMQSKMSLAYTYLRQDVRAWLETDRFLMRLPVIFVFCFVFKSFLISDPPCRCMTRR